MTDLSDTRLELLIRRSEGQADRLVVPIERYSEADKVENAGYIAASREAEKTCREIAAAIRQLLAILPELRKGAMAAQGDKLPTPQEIAIETFSRRLMRAAGCAP